MGSVSVERDFVFFFFVELGKMRKMIFEAIFMYAAKLLGLAMASLVECYCIFYTCLLL